MYTTKQCYNGFISYTHLRDYTFTKGVTLIMTTENRGNSDSGDSSKSKESQMMVKAMPKEIKQAVSKLTPFKKKYCEMRSKGLSQGEAALRSGSKCTGPALNRTGYNVERDQNARDYIEWLMLSRAAYAVVDDTELIDKTRALYDAAFEAGKYADAIKAIDLLAHMSGILGTKSKYGKNSTNDPNSRHKDKIKNNVKAFTEEDETSNERIKKMSKLIKVL